MKPRAITRFFLLGLATFVLPNTAFPAETKTGKGPQRWEETIRKFEAADAANPAPRGAILLVGGSNARRWTDVADYFPGEAVINRGFGGAQLAEVLHFADRIVLPYAPKAIILNGGGNDLAAGKSPEAVRDACHAFVARVHAALPKTRVYYIAIPPVLRAARAPESMAAIRRTNGLIAELARKTESLEFIDLFPKFLGPDGQPRVELFVEDGTHFTPQGYAIVAALVRENMAR
jgi:lysophospholipase L1-like esterase